jgi:hypothetical protein
MSNFLQRVAATVIQPKARLQPMFGSIFAPATLPSPAEFFPVHTEISSQAFAPHRHEPTHFEGPGHAFVSEAISSEDRLFPPTVPEDSSPARSNRSFADDQLLLPVFNGGPGPTEPRSSVEDAGLVFESSKVAAADHSVPPYLYQTLIAAGQQPTPRLQPRESPPNPAAVRTSASETARRFQPAQREPDEIHIHIGRIEVAAIAQPAPRPAAAAARRSLNLDEYLRRGNGRPG